ncbi:hypothetical protein [Halobacillus sp. BBL2006]|uniref:hypothetical protein n=1 Tax=Halobacillus sp. BBL2006 TaxID=1543706 RepID=UPI00068E5C0C|nr:hypothetical protein [Halobacillus sp. BBL2006]
MKKYYMLSMILALGLLLGACGTSEDNQESSDSGEQTSEQQDSEATSGEVDDSEDSSGENSETSEGKDMELSSGIDTVMASVKELQTSLENSADVSTVNEQGKKLEEDWDSIEKKVEEQFPDLYEKIEESLYPLINEAKKDEPDMEKMKEWVQPTLDSLNELKKNVTSK